MSKFNKIILLINLLFHRHSVTMETIKKVCKIPERTAYRYLNTISRANIPVYFDKNARAYRINNYKTESIDDLTVEEQIFIVVALKILSQSLAKEYSNDIENLIHKVLSRQPMPIEEIFHSFKHDLEVLEPSPDISTTISSILINAAILCRRKICLTINKKGSRQAKVEIEKPSLRFNKGWYVKPSNYDDAPATSLDGVKKVQII